MPAEPIAPMVAELTFTVTPTDTAAAVGSGALPVLGTPILLAWLEAATCAALEPTLAADETSVGTRVRLEHQAPSGVGSVVVVRAELQHADGRLRRFEAVARTPQGAVLGHAEITRAVVPAERFMARVPAAEIAADTPEPRAD